MWCRGGHTALSMAATGHCVEHVACGEVGKVGAELGWLLVNLGLGPKSKVAAHLMIYKTH